MQHKKIVFYFLGKILLIYLLFIFPLSFVEKGYHTFYNKICKRCFNSFAGHGFVWFDLTEKPNISQINIGNYQQVKPDNTTNTIKAEVNIRHRGYVPSLFLFILILASPLVWRKKLFAMSLGLGILTLFILWKQWMHLRLLCSQYDWINLLHFDEKEKQSLTFWYDNFVTYPGPTFMIVIVLWCLLCSGQVFSQTKNARLQSLQS